MKRSSLTHRRVFDDEPFAQQYAERHHKMAEKFRREYAEKTGLGSRRRTCTKSRTTTHSA
jgi:hypothetical protein